MFKTLKVVNFGPYNGKYTFDLKTNTNKNIIHFHGGIGSGKSTFIRLLKLGLYGKLNFNNKDTKNMFFKRTENQEYKEYIKNSLNRRAKLNKQNHITLKLTIDLKIRGKIKEYTIVRKYDLSNDFEEEFKIYNKNKELNPSKAIKIQKYIKLSYPIKYFDFFLFDGDSFDPLLKENFQNNFEDIIKTIFNLDLVDNLINDIENIKNIDNKVKLFETMDMMKYQYQQIKEKVKKTNDDKKEKKLKQKLSKLNKKLKKQYKKNNFPEIKNNLLNTFKSYHQNQYSKKMKELEKNYNEIVNTLVIQVNNANINFDNMKIDFFQNNLKYDLKHSFSTSEGQLLYFALLVALLKTSNKSFPLITENPFIAMDNTHTLQIKEFLAELNQQVILLNIEEINLFNINHNYQLKKEKAV